MGYSISAWRSDGPSGESQIISHSIKRVAEIPALVEHLKTLPRVVLIAKERSPSRAIGYRFYQLWKKPGYQSATTE